MVRIRSGQKTAAAVAAAAASFFCRIHLWRSRLSSLLSFLERYLVEEEGECLVAFKTMRGYLQKFISHYFGADVIGW